MDSTARLRYPEDMWWSAARRDSSWWWFQRNAWRGLLVVGAAYFCVAAWGAWRDNGRHAAQRAAFLADCAAERGRDRCEALIEAHDADCLHASGLLLDRASGPDDYARCLVIGRAAYLTERGRKHAAQRRRQQAWQP